jgi:hypothetical protein
MSKPKVTIILDTVRPDAAYEGKPDWHVIGTVLSDLNKQTYKDFELIIVDGVEARVCSQYVMPTGYPVHHVTPMKNVWTRNKKVAISTFRNTALTLARGELVINLDDCCRLPPSYIEIFAAAYFDHGICLSATWPQNGDVRAVGLGGNEAAVAIMQNKLWVSRGQAPPGGIYGFGSYPLEKAVEVNGYDLAYDGRMYLEDADFSTRLAAVGVKMHLAFVPGFKQGEWKPDPNKPPEWHQSRHHPDAIDVTDGGITGCCNCAWQTQRVERNIIVANRVEDWTPEWIEKLLGPCHYLRPGTNFCQHHLASGNEIVCDYLTNKLFKDTDGEMRSFATHRHPLAVKLLEEPPVFDLAKARKE